MLVTVATNMDREQAQYASLWRRPVFRLSAAWNRTGIAYNWKWHWSQASHWRHIWYMKTFRLRCRLWRIRKATAGLSGLIRR